MLPDDPANVHSTLAKVAVVNHDLNISSHHCNLEENVVEQTGELTIATLQENQLNNER